MKTIKLTILLFALPFAASAQTLTGLWIGSISNDSTTVRKDQSFEIVLTLYKQKVYGYSRATFIVNDTLFYIVKRVKGTIDGDICEVKDDEIVSYNFKGRLDKGVKMVSTFRFDHTGSVWRMDGAWKTTQTKKFYTVTGKMALKTETDLDNSKIIPHLEELKLTEEIAVYQEAKVKKEQERIAAASIRQPQAIKETKKETAPKLNQNNQTATTTKPVVRENPAITTPAKTETTVAKTIEKPADIPVNNPPVNNNKTETAAVNKQPVTNPVNENRTTTVKTETAAAKTGNTPVLNQAVATRNEIPANTNNAAIASDTKREENKVPVKTEVAKTSELKEIPNTTPAASSSKKQEETTVAIVKDKPQMTNNLPGVKPAVSQATAFIKERKVASQQTVFFKSDSLELALYDNGEIDGDTVSIMINDELVLAKQGLKATAIKKTVYVPAGQTDSLTLVLYAENLGKYPPNTGLLVVHDGDDTYQVRFSADLQQNAAVIFKRKR